jgi:hypothetical protein
MRRFREPPRTGSEPVTDRFRQPVPGGGLYRPLEPVPTVQPKEDQQTKQNERRVHHDRNT